MSRLRTLLAKPLRRFLAKRGYRLSHYETGMPEAMESYLIALAGRGIHFEQICVFDDDPETLNTFLAVFEANRVFFHAARGFENPSLPVQKGERLLLETDFTGLYEKGNSSPLAYSEYASVVVIRSKLSHFLAAKADLCDISDQMAAAGFRLQDVLQQPPLTHLNAPTANVFLAFERADIGDAEAHDSHGGGRALRVSEALNHLTHPIVPQSGLHRLSARGSHGFSAGLLNPGAFCDGERIFLLARGERFPWPIQKHSQKSYLSSCQPMLLTLRNDLQISKAAEVRFHGTHNCQRFRFEDFRVFSHQGRIYSNHSMIQLEEARDGRTPIRPEKLRTMIGLSLFESEEPLLTYLGSPTLDRPVARMEKNWAMFSTGELVHLIYSFNPYRLFSTAALPDLRFSCALECRLNLPLLEDGLSFRNSINPVSYDEGYLLHLVHKVYPGKRYIFWAVLIDKMTLLPVKISRRPLLSAGSSAAASTIYACSAISRKDDLVVFGGIDDCAVGGWRVAKADLDRHWISIA